MRRPHNLRRWHSKLVQELLIDLAATLPHKYAAIMRQEKLDAPPSQPTTRRRRQLQQAHAKEQSNQLAWSTTTKVLQTKWLNCSTWTILTADRTLWREATDFYLGAKFTRNWTAHTHTHTHTFFISNLTLPSTPFPPHHVFTHPEDTMVVFCSGSFTTYRDAPRKHTQLVSQTRCPLFINLLGASKNFDLTLIHTPTNREFDISQTINDK